MVQWWRDINRSDTLLESWLPDKTETEKALYTMYFKQILLPQILVTRRSLYWRFFWIFLALWRILLPWKITHFAPSNTQHTHTSTEHWGMNSHSSMSAKLTADFLWNPYLLTTFLSHWSWKEGWWFDGKFSLLLSHSHSFWLQLPW